jgi:hypothetical protein
MTTSLQYETHHIMLWTIREIRVTSVKNKKQFHVRCHMKTYQHANSSIRERHSTMFREENFIFTPIDELVMSMPFEFISNLKVGTWTRVDPSWLRRLQKFLSHADNHAIKRSDSFGESIVLCCMLSHKNIGMKMIGFYMKYSLQRVTNIM